MKIKKYIPKFIFSVWHYSLAFLGALIYRFPASKIKVVGITGTNGKSTTANICDAVLSLKYKTASMSSIRFKIGEKEEENKLKMTMPGRFKIQKFLREAVDQKCEVCIIEVTSEGIEQFRHKFIDFDACIFTNLSKEHIESHGSFEKYREAKGKFFKENKKIHILNQDDENFKYFNAFEAQKKITYSLKSESDFRGELIEVSENGSKFKVGDDDFETSLLGDFNIYNCLAAIALGKEFGVSLEDIKKGIKNAEAVPGRMEKVISEPFSFYIDYAITPYALEKAYKFLKPDIVILGACGGGRDKWKREVFGQLADQYAKTVIITNEDPYDEDPDQIMEDILKGSKKGIKISDRRAAIKKAMEIVQHGEIILATGKGSEDCIMQKGKKLPWKEKEVILEEYKKEQL